MQNLSQDIIGTNPKYPSIVDHSWLSVNPETYDNYPSDNNPVRVQPKLSDIWNPARKSSGVDLVQNSTVQPLGVRTAEQQELEQKETVASVIREAKKAFMSGMGVRKAAEHLQSLYTPDQLRMAQDGLKTVSEEHGLLGNVYIDASAFATYNEAEQFLTQHRNRLAQDILFDCEKMNPGIVAALASKFRKNVVSNINYDDRLFQKYRDHLLVAGRIPDEMVIDSKESLKKAFLFEMPKPAPAPEKEPEKSMDAAEIEAGLAAIAEEKRVADQETEEVLQWGSVKPIVSFVQEYLSKGKTAQDLKEMVKARFPIEDLKTSVPYLAVVLSSEGLSKGHLNKLAAEGRISEFAADQLETISKMYPVTKSEFEDPMPERSAGVQARFYSPYETREVSDGASHKAARDALRMGIEPTKVRAKLTSKVGRDEADKIMTAVMVELNSRPAGVESDLPTIEKKKEALYEEPPVESRLPDPAKINDEVKEFHDVFAGASEMVVDIDPVVKRESYDILDAGSKDGLDGAIGDALK